MKRCRFSLWLAALALPALLPPAQATTVIAPGFDQLVDRADYVVRATVKSVTSDWRDNPDSPGTRYIGTRVELEVHEVIKGNPPARLVLDLVGGRVGDDTLKIDGAPQFIVGQRNILFIRGNGQQVIPLVGLHHGRFLLRRDPATGRDLVMRNNGRYLYNVREISRPGSDLSRDPRAIPLSAAEFSARIRGAIRQPEENREPLD